MSSVFFVPSPSLERQKPRRRRERGGGEGKRKRTCSPSGVTARFGQKADACSIEATTSLVAASTTTVSGVKDEQTNASLPSGENATMPGPSGTRTSPSGAKGRLPSRIWMRFSPRTAIQTSSPEGDQEASCGLRPTEVTLRTAWPSAPVASRNATASEPTHTAATVLRSGLNPDPWTIAWPR